MDSFLPNTALILITLVVLATVFVAFVRERTPPFIVALCGMCVLLFIGAISTNDLLGVFSNSAAITIACMFIISAALVQTGVIDILGKYLLHISGKSKFFGILVTFIVVFVISAFMNNTPVVIIMTPVFIILAKRLKDYPSKYLIPLSYASIMGGACTLIGSSTNILVSSVAAENGMKPFTLFEISTVGLMLALAGFTFMATVGRFLLPERHPSKDEFEEDRQKKRFLAEATIPEDSPILGKTINEIILTRAEEYEIIDLIREERAVSNMISYKKDGFLNKLFSTMSSSKDEDDGVDKISSFRDTPLQVNDRLVFRVDKDALVVLQKHIGIDFDVYNSKSGEETNYKKLDIIEAIIPPNSNFIGHRIKDLKLRRVYGCFVIGLHRKDENIVGDLAQMELKDGDSLIIEGEQDDLDRLSDNEQILNAEYTRSVNADKTKAPIAIGVLISVIAFSAIGFMPIAGMAFLGAVTVIITGCVTPENAYRTIDWRILLLIFGMLGIGTAMQNTGAATLIVENAMGFIDGLGPIYLLAGVFILTSILTEVITNNAVAILLTPIVIAVSTTLGYDPRPFVVAVMMASSSSFATPIGYQTNTFVYTAGGYKFKDFLKIGVPMNLIMFAVAIYVIPIFFEF